MIGTTDYADMVRCIARDDWVTYDRITARVNEENAWEGWSEFLTASCHVAVEQRFARTVATVDQAELTRLVADARAQFSDSGGDIEPAAAERMIHSILGPARAAGIDSRTVVEFEMLVLRKVLRDANPTPELLDTFLAKVDGIRAGWHEPPDE